MTTKFKFFLNAGFLVASIVSAASAFALTLPPVSSCGLPAPNDNLLCYSPKPGVSVYIASKHDDFISYSANAMKQLANGFGYTGLSEWSSLPPFGSGQITKLFTFNNSNNGTFPDATAGTGDNQAPAPNGDLTPKADGLYQGNWPVGSTVTVGQLLAYITPGTSPVFTFDLNNNNLGLNGYLDIIGADGTTFAFDNIANHAYDAASFVPAIASVPVTWMDVGNPACPGGLCSMVVDNNVGSGKPDFFAYAPDLDLSKYAATDTLHFYLSMTGLVSGGEELAITNIVGTPPTIPEPGMLVLMGAGLLGLAYSRRKVSDPA